MQIPPDHDGVRAAVAYGNVARTVVLRLKHGRRIALARFIGAIMARKLDPKPGALLVPVPLHRWRIWVRGFNQSLALAKEIAARTGFEIRGNALIRRKRTPVLGGLGAAQRAKAVSGAFAVNPGVRDMVRGKAIVLVDDVYTSGATANACARALKRAGASSVIVLCWARVLRDD
jgi:ComF family protein